MAGANSSEFIPTRATLIHRLKNWRDDASWQVFFDTYWKLIYDVAIEAGVSPAEAEDVVQETIVSVAKHMPTFQYDPSIGSFKKWLSNMTRWRIIDHLRKENPKTQDRKAMAEKAGETPALHQLPDPAATDFDTFWNAKWRENLLVATMAKIKRQVDPQKYQIFDFYVNKEWPPEQVAKKFGVTPDQVYLIKHRVLRLIQKEVKRVEAEFR